MKLKQFKQNLPAVGILLVLMFAAFGAKAQKTRELMQDDDDKKPQKRTALVIGNANYTVARKLANSSNDATDMANSLSAVGFEVVSGTNLNLKEMNDKVREFGDKLKVNGGVGLFYYAGHGIQVTGKNYLIPVDAAIPREDEVDFNALNLEIVLRKMATANNGLNIVILDACRNNPFARSWSRGDDEGGLAQISAPTGTFIAYSTSPDKTASDGTGRNGLYTAELLKVMKQPNMKIEETFKEVRKAVSKSSGGKQIPWDSSSLSGDFYFKSDDDGGGNGTTENKTKTANAENVFWKSIENSDDPKDFETFLKQYPRSVYASVAQNKLRKLTAKINEPEKKPEPVKNGTKPVNVGVVNSRASRLARPKYPAAAKAANAAGAVSVQVVIDQEGNVTSAVAVSGHSLLKDAAVEAALASKFNPIMVNGKVVEVTGVIVYNFINQ